MNEPTIKCDVWYKHGWQTWYEYPDMILTTVVLPEPDTHRGNRECASDMRRAKQWPRECVSDPMLASDMPAIFCVEEYGEWVIIRPYTTVVLPTPNMMPDNHWHPWMSVQTWRNWIAWGMECDQNRD